MHRGRNEDTAHNFLHPVHEWRNKRIIELVDIKEHTNTIQ